MPAAPRIDPKEVFSAAEWERLTTPSRWRGLALVAHCWGVILAGGALFVLFPNPFTYILAVMIIGAGLKGSSQEKDGEEEGHGGRELAMTPGHFIFHNLKIEEETW